MNACPKLNLIRDRKYLDSQHDDRCLISGELGDDNETIDPAHLGSKRNHGDDETLPIKHRFHAYGHQHSEVAMWRRYLPDDVLMDALRAYARERYRIWRREHE